MAAEEFILYSDLKFDPTIFMEDIISKESRNSEDIQERDDIIMVLMNEHNPYEPMAPFVFVPSLPPGATLYKRTQEETDKLRLFGEPRKSGFFHYKLQISSSTNDIEGFITKEMFDNTIRWCIKHLWFRPDGQHFVHGDLSLPNIVVNGQKLFFVDYEAGLTRSVDICDEEGQERILEDITDFCQNGVLAKNDYAKSIVETYGLYESFHYPVCVHPDYVNCIMGKLEEHLKSYLRPRECDSGPSNDIEVLMEQCMASRDDSETSRLSGVLEGGFNRINRYRRTRSKRNKRRKYIKSKKKRKGIKRSKKKRNKSRKK